MKKSYDFSAFDPTASVAIGPPDWRKWLRDHSRRLWLASALTLYAVILAVIWEANAAGPERWWLGTLNVYLPQWAWLIPGFALLICCLFIARSWAVVPVLLLLLVAGPIMGFCWNSLSQTQATLGFHLRVMTYNCEGEINNPLVMTEMVSAHPDLVFCQESGVQSPLFLKAHPDWFGAGPFGQCYIMSRYPLSHIEAHSLPLAAGAHQYIRCQMTVNNKVVTLYDLHLDTPRWGFEAVKTHQVGAVTSLEEDTTMRLYQASKIAEDVHLEKGPVLVVGDFNAPPQSMVCRTFYEYNLQDAFSASGRGYGYSYGQRLRGGQSYVRIDHILTSPGWQAVSCWTGGDQGSDHRPVIADLILK